MEGKDCGMATCTGVLSFSPSPFPFFSLTQVHTLPGNLKKESRFIQFTVLRLQSQGATSVERLLAGGHSLNNPELVYNITLQKDNSVYWLWSFPLLIKHLGFSHENPTLMTPSTPNHLPNAVPLNSIVELSFDPLNTFIMQLNLNT